MSSRAHGSIRLESEPAGQPGTPRAAGDSNVARARRAVASRPGLATFASLGVAYAVFVWLSTALMPVDSDKVWVQTVLSLRGHYGRMAMQASQDNFSLKYPLYLLAQHLFGTSYAALVFEIVVMNVVFFGAVAGAYVLLVRYGVISRARWWIVALVGLWVVSTGDPTGPIRDSISQPTATLINPNERNMELGLAVLVLVVAGLLYLGRMGSQLRTVWRILAGTALAVLAAELCYDDPYNLYLLLVPLVLAGVVHAARARTVRAVVAGGRWQLWYFLAATGVGYELLTRAGPHVGIYASGNAPRAVFVGNGQIVSGVQGLVSSVAMVFGGSFFGRPVSVSTLPLFLNGVAAFVVLACALWMLRGWYLPGNSVVILLPIAVLVIVTVYVISGRSVDAAHVRYLIALVPLGFLLVPTVLDRLRGTERGLVSLRLVCALLVVATLLNVGHSVRNSSRVFARGDVNASLWGRTGAIGQLGLTKGYAGYWNANVNTYLSAGKQVTISVRCTRRRLQVYSWDMDTAWLRKPAARTFYIWDPAAAEAGQCTMPRLAAQFGAPAQTVALPRHQRLLVYDYDILSRMSPRRASTS